MFGLALLSAFPDLRCPASQKDWLQAREQAEREFRAATQDLNAPAAVEVLRSIYTVPPADGRALYDLVVGNGCRRVLDIGTGRGASALWMALGVSRTGGKVTTIEFNPTIAASAGENFSRSGIADRIRLVIGDAQRELRRMGGQWDLVFVDIGSEDAARLVEDVYPRLTRGGTLVVHDVLDGSSEREYVRLIRRHPGLKTTVDRKSRFGLAVSTKE